MANENASAKSKKSTVNTIDEAFAKIEEKIEAMKGENVSLEEAFDCFQEGMQLVQYANHSIDQVEKKVKLIMENGEEEDFD